MFTGRLKISRQPASGAGYIDTLQGNTAVMRLVQSSAGYLNLSAAGQVDSYGAGTVYARGTEAFGDARALLDATPYGRQQKFEDSPAGWPQKPTYG
jgi:hypothetical protein